uniref:Uncharacterized protein n=1 Tax=Megaselia scalaris TaxID=36166 RepID=T1GZJ3_MEGSC
MAMVTIAMEVPGMITMAVIVVEIMVTEAMTTPDHPVDMAMVNTIVILISKPPLLIHH